MKTRILIATAAMALIPLGAALAQDGSDDTASTGATTATQTEQHGSKVSDLNQPAEQKKEAAEAKVEAKKAEICARRQSRLDARENVVARHDTALMSHYIKVEQRLQAEIDRATKDGVTGDNLTKVQADLATFKEKVAKLQTDLDKLEADITNVKANLHCDSTDGSSTARAQVRADKKAVIADRVALHKFYAQTIVADRNKLRQDIQKAEQKTNTSNTSGTDKTETDTTSTTKTQ